MSMLLWIKHLILATIGGFIYTCIELLFRQRTHWSMFLVGGILFLLVGLINEFYTWETPLWKQGLIASGIITVVEYVAGLLFNIWLKMDVWDYSGQFCNLQGQICLLFSFLWVWVGLFAIFLDDTIRWLLFKEEKPHYKIL